ncbi:MAG: hypothetical protein IT530_15575 [Burkholderiales bacterium]|nr:hypothetical protein [Burkholderiales bacterium]
MIDEISEGSAPCAPAGIAPVARPMRSVSVEERRRLVAESLHVGNPGNNARDLPDHADLRTECQIELSVDDICPYEGNPRRASNAKFAEIKESIRVSGVRNPLTVTRRPGEAHFIVESGGNTRLIAIQQLWSETRDERFRKLVLLYRPWRSEAHVLTSHLIENDQRGEVTFWDKATGIVTLKARLEAERGEAFSLRQLEESLRALGLSVNTATLAHYLFATERLRTLGESIPELSGLDVKIIQPRLNALKRYARSRATLADEDLYATVFEPAFRQITEDYAKSVSFSATAVCEACEEALSRRFDEPVEQLRRGLNTFVRPSPTQAAPPAPASSYPATANTIRAGERVSTANGTSPGQLPRARLVPARTLAETRDGTEESLVDRVVAFAAKAGIDDCVRRDAAAPLGYYLEALLTADRASSTRHRAWNLLAALNGQLEDTTLAPYPDGAFFSWLTDTNDNAATAFWNLLSLARESEVARERPRAATVPADAQQDC